ncbi:MAG: DUF998 domain-containing protein [Halobacteriales archaeon]|nr:DUF998 domain-containing protein [Halobacteriales archaeon]
MKDTASRVAPWTAVVAAIVAFGAILTTTTVAPWFSWTGNALSDLGHHERATANLFNGGLIVAGLTGAVFPVRLLADYDGILRRLGAGVITLTLVDLALIGVFPTPHELHGAVSVAFFVGVTLGLVLWGVGDLVADRRRRGVAIAATGVFHAVFWAVWVSPAVPYEGVAVPEFVGAVALAGTALTVTRDYPEAFESVRR